MTRTQIHLDKRSPSCPLTTQTACEGKILGLYSDTLRVNGGEIGVLKEGDEVSFCCLLQSHYSRRLEAQVRLEVLRDLADETLEGELPDKKLSRFLVATNFAQCHRSGAETMGLFYTSRCGGGRCLTRRLGSELLAGGLATGGLASGLLGTSH